MPGHPGPLKHPVEKETLTYVAFALQHLLFVASTFSTPCFSLVAKHSNNV